MKNNNDFPTTIAVLAIILTILGFIMSALAPFIGPLAALIVVAFIGGGVTFVWVDRRLPRRTR
jgi:hypothetical protein